jgi:hypothetical protein
MRRNPPPEDAPVSVPTNEPEALAKSRNPAGAGREDGVFPNAPAGTGLPPSLRVP